MSASAVYEGWVRHRRFKPVEHSFRYRFFLMCFYYCFDSAGQRVEAVVADVENIPWGERHAYVLARGEREGPVLSDELDKALHVSPLMGMDQTYAFRATEPGPRLAVNVESRARAGAGGKSFDATPSLRRRELSRPLLAGLLARYPAMSLQVVAKIYAQSLRLKLKGARYFPRPDGKKPKGFVSP